MQEQALEFISKQIENQTYEETKSENFISTNATREVEEKIQNTLNIRARQRKKDFPNEAVGINGILLEGDSGSGKSEMIRAILEKNQIDGKPVCCKIDTSQTLEKKKELIIKAFEEGNIVWIDELNSCIDDGLEKILNAVLTGAHPDTGKKSDNPGFTLLASINEINLEGRSAISPALLHRLQHVKTKPLSEYLLEDVVKIVAHWIGDEEKEKAAAIASEFVQRKPSQKNFNLRTLRQIATDPTFIDTYQIPKEDKKFAALIEAYKQRQNLPKIKNFKEKFAEIEEFINENPDFKFSGETANFLDRKIKYHYSLSFRDEPEKFVELKTAINNHEGYERFFEFDETSQTLQILVPAKILKTLDKDILKSLVASFPELTIDEQVENNYTIYRLKSEERKKLEADDLQEMRSIAKKDVSFTKAELEQELFYRQQNIVQPIAEINSFAELQSKSFCVGEFHEHKSSKRILIDNMNELKEKGFATIFLEGLIYDSVTQDSLNEYFEDTSATEMPNPLKEELQTSDSSFKNPDYGYYELVKTAKEQGLRCVGIESNYSCTIPESITSRDNKVKRLKDMNYAAKAIIEKESGGKKWAAIIGNAHLKTRDGVPGVSDLMGVPAVYVYDSTIKTEVEATFGRAITRGIESEVRIACPENISLNFNDITKTTLKLSEEMKPSAGTSTASATASALDPVDIQISTINLPLKKGIHVNQIQIEQRSVE